MDTLMEMDEIDSDSNSGSSEPELDLNIMTDMLSMQIPHCTRSPSNSSLESSTPPSPVTPTTRMDDVPPRTHNGRQRLRPWLIGLIDSGKVKGLEWMNKEKTLFRIPWKHAGKQDYNPEEDSKVFKLWSTNTGKYKEGVHVPEPAVWKTRLRTALNKLPDIDEIQEKTQLDIPEPYRVYRLLPKKSKFPAGPRGRTTSYPGQDPSAYSPVQINHTGPMSAPAGVGLYQRGHMYDLKSSMSPYDRSAYYEHGTGHNMHASYGYTYGHGHQYRQDPSLDIALSDVEHVIQQNEHPSPTPSPQFTGHDMTASCSPPAGAMPFHPHGHPDVAGDETASKIAEAMMTNNNDPSQINNYHDLLPPSTAEMYPTSTYGNPTYTTCTPVTMATDTMTTVDHHHQRTHHESMDVSCRSQENRQSELPSEHSMTIQVYYRSLQALSRQVDNSSGCMLYSKQPWDEGIHLGMDPIALPDITDIIDPHTGTADQTIGLTNEVLQCFQKGISIQFKNGGDVYVTRRCRSVVFWSIAAGRGESQRHEKLERDHETKVFDLQEFRDKMRDFLTGNGKSPEVPTIYFTVAQKWGPESSLHSCLVSIVVTPLRAAIELRSINHDIKTPPVSYHSGLLCISGPDVPTPPNYEHPWGGAELSSHSPYYSTPPSQVFAACMT